MRSIDELNPHKFPTTPLIDSNLATLFQRAMELQDAYGEELHVTSGLRSEAFQMELIAQGKTHAKHSLHESGCAVDFADPAGELAGWIKQNLHVCARIGFWFESFDHTKGWCHCQWKPPGSGNIIFIP